MTGFAVEPGPRYAGPHGPVEIPAQQEPGATRVLTPTGEARLGWSMERRDRQALDAGVPASLGGREGVLRRQGRTLVLERSGAPQAVVRLLRFGKVALERPDGTRLASYKRTRLAGTVEDAAAADDVALLVLLLASDVAGTLERGVPLPIVPGG